MQDFDFFFDARIVDARILQTVTKRFVVEQNLRAGSDKRGSGRIPVINPFVLLHQTRSLSPLALRTLRAPTGAETKNRGRETSFSKRYGRFEILRRFPRQIQISETRRRPAPNPLHNDTTTAFRAPANGPHRCIWFAPFRASPPCRACGPTRWRRSHREVLPRCRSN